MSFGGGGESGGAVVGGPNQLAALAAGQYQAQAAAAAQAQAQQALNDSIAAINKNYAQARYDVAPYRTTGVQALDQLNQYMGLSAYNPGAAPNAPKKLTAADLKDQISDAAINQYVNQNTGYTTVKGFTHPVYTGAGSDNQTLINAYKGQAGNWGVSGPGSLVSAVSLDRANPLGAMPGASIFLQNPNQSFNQIIRDAVINKLGGDLATQKNVGFEDRMASYNQDLNEYNQNLALYNKYNSEGPLTSEQITNKISNLPGYQAQLNQGIDAITRNAAGRGYLGSGRLLQELSDYGQNTLSTFYGNELSRLAQLAGGGQQAAGQSAQSANQQGANLANLYSNFGDTSANASLATGNALAQAMLAGNQQYKIIGGQSGGSGLGGLGGLLGGAASLLGSSSMGGAGLLGLFG